MDKARVAQYLVVDALRLAIAGAVLFWAAGTIHWWAGWATFAVLVAAEGAMSFIGIRIHPGLSSERIGARTSDKKWDLPLYYGLRILPVGYLVLGGLGERYGWASGFPFGIQLAGLVATLLGYALFIWARASNAFFSALVRIQTERGHTVATGGPYRFVRHPGYLGGLVTELAIPLLLASWWALLPGALCVMLFVLRTALEDRTLQAELPGDADYAGRVRYRLLPGVW